MSLLRSPLQAPVVKRELADVPSSVKVEKLADGSSSVKVEKLAEVSSYVKVEKQAGICFNANAAWLRASS